MPAATNSPGLTPPPPPRVIEFPPLTETVTSFSKRMLLASWSPETATEPAVPLMPAEKWRLSVLSVATWNAPAATHGRRRSGRPAHYFAS